MVISPNTSFQYPFQDNGNILLWNHNAGKQALFSCFANLKNEHNVSSVLKHDTNAQKFPMAPLLLQNKSRICTMTHGIWLPGSLSSPSSFQAFSTLVFLCSLGPAGSLLLHGFVMSSFLYIGHYCRAWLMPTFSGKTLAVLVKICTPPPFIMTPFLIGTAALFLS